MIRLSVFALPIVALVTAGSTSAHSEEYPGYTCVEGERATIRVTSQGGGGAQYTLRNECDDGMFIAVETFNGRSTDCDVIYIGRGSTGSAVSYNNRPPRILGGGAAPPSFPMSTLLRNKYCKK